MGKIEGKPTVAVLAQAINDHVESCERQGLANGKLLEAVDKRMGRIESIWIAVAGALILQLIGGVVALAVFAVTHPASAALPPPH